MSKHLNKIDKVLALNELGHGEVNKMQKFIHILLYLWLVRACSCSILSHVRLFETPWTVAYKSPLSMEFSRQEYWSGLPIPSPGDLPNSGIKPTSPVFPEWSGGFFTTEPLGKWLVITALFTISYKQ